MIGADEYVEFLSREYLRGYVDEGGSAVKFVVADDFVASGFRDRVADEGDSPATLSPPWMRRRPACT